MEHLVWRLKKFDLGGPRGDFTFAFLVSIYSFVSFLYYHRVYHLVVAFLQFGGHEQPWLWWRFDPLQRISLSWVLHPLIFEITHHSTVRMSTMSSATRRYSCWSSTSLSPTMRWRTKSVWKVFPGCFKFQVRSFVETISTSVGLTSMRCSMVSEHIRRGYCMMNDENDCCSSTPRSRTLRSDSRRNEETVLIFHRYVTDPLRFDDGHQCSLVISVSSWIKCSNEVKEAWLDNSKSPRQLFHARRNKNSSFSTMTKLDACVQTMSVNYHSRATVWWVW